jgi:hypothetical protein
MAQPLFPDLKPVLPGRVNKKPGFLLVDFKMAAKKEKTNQCGVWGQVIFGEVQ